MMKEIAIRIVIGFVIRELEKFEHEIDWTKVKKNLDDRIRLVLPGTWFDDEGVRIADSALEWTKKVLSQGSQIKSILEFLAAGKYDDAAKYLKALLLGELSHINVSYTIPEMNLKEALLLV